MRIYRARYLWITPIRSICPTENECRRRQEVLGDFPGGLKDLDTTRQDVRDALFDVFARWIEVGDFDGFRIDTLKHVEQGFWEDFCPRIRQFAKDVESEGALLGTQPVPIELIRDLGRCSRTNFGGRVGHQLLDIGDAQLAQHSVISGLQFRRIAL